MRCQRCGKETDVHIMSMFNTDEICMECKEKEKRHPKYKDACDADHEEIKKKNYNFKGIGKPDDL